MVDLPHWIHRSLGLVEEFDLLHFVLVEQNDHFAAYRLIDPHIAPTFIQRVVNGLSIAIDIHAPQFAFFEKRGDELALDLVKKQFVGAIDDEGIIAQVNLVNLFFPNQKVDRISYKLGSIRPNNWVFPQSKSGIQGTVAEGIAKGLHVTFVNAHIVISQQMPDGIGCCQWHRCDNWKAIQLGAVNRHLRRLN